LTESGSAAIRPRIAVFAGATATILNSAPLVTSQQARERHGLPALDINGGRRFDALRPQRLAKAITAYVEQFSAHPLEDQAAHLYAPPDGYLNAAGEFNTERRDAADTPVYEVQLRPEDGLLPLPYMARQADGSAWEDDTVRPGARADESRQPFYPDAARIFEEIDRLAIDEHGHANVLSSQADFDFVRVLPPGGYPSGIAGDRRTDAGSGDVAPESLYADYFPYRPYHLRREPPRAALAQVTNRVQAALDAGSYDGAVWLEGSPFIEESIYWLNLLIDTDVPIVACSSPDFPHGTLGAGGDRHIVDAVRYVCSRIWADERGADRVGAVLMSAEQLFAARDVQKADARPGGYVATGGHGGIVATTGEPGPPVLTYVPVRRHTSTSEVRLSMLPAEVSGVAGDRSGGLSRVTVAVKGGDGSLLPAAIPHVALWKHARYLAADATTDPSSEVELLARIERNLRANPLAGFVVEGGAPYGSSAPSADAALRRASFSGMPVVRTSRGNAEGFVSADRVKVGIAGSNLTATKARMLLMACLMRFGSLPVAADPDHPTASEIRAVEDALRQYQQVFDTH
jgi:hypothetical protein